MKKFLVVAIVAALLSVTSHAEDHPFLDATNAACMEGPLAQFGRYIGDWKITDETLARDGSAWSPGNGARWIFTCIGNGTAIQDFWLPQNGGFGTNIRTFNTETETWDIVWAASSLNGLQHISARQQDDDSIVMRIISPVQDRPRRIVFFTPEGEGWHWAMQWSLDDEETWFDVYRIVATPWQEVKRD